MLRGCAEGTRGSRSRLPPNCAQGKIRLPCLCQTTARRERPTRMRSPGDAGVPMRMLEASHHQRYLAERLHPISQPQAARTLLSWVGGGTRRSSRQHPRRAPHPGPSSHRGHFHPCFLGPLWRWLNWEARVAVGSDAGLGHAMGSPGQPGSGGERGQGCRAQPQRQSRGRAGQGDQHSEIWRGTGLQRLAFLQHLLLRSPLCSQGVEGRGLRLRRGARTKARGCLSRLRGCCCGFVLN